MSQSFAEALSWVPVSRTLGSTLARAHDYARSQSHRTVALEHVLLALAEDSDAMMVLQASSIDVGRLMGDISALLGRSEDRFSPGQPIDPAADEALIRILDYAAAAARQSRRREINGAIVLAAIVGEGRSTAASLLQSQGLTFEGAIKALQRSQSASVTPPATPEPARHVQPPPMAPPATINGAATEANEQMLSRVRRRIDETRTAPPASPVAPVREPYPQPPVTPPRPIQPTATAITAAPPTIVQPTPAPVVSSLPSQAVSDGASDPLSEADGWLPPSSAQASSPPAPMPSSPAPMPAAEQPRPSRLPPPLPPVEARPPAPSSIGDRPADLSTLSERRPLDVRSRVTAPVVPPGSISSVPWPEPVQPQPQALPTFAPKPLVPSLQTNNYPADGGIAGPPYLNPDLASPPPPVPAANLPVPRNRDTQLAAPRIRAAIEAGQLVENIPRNMRVDQTVTVEVRIAKANLKALADGLEGRSSVFSHVIVVTKAMSVRLRAPDSAFVIETASPETQWIENALDQPGDDFASWRWHVTPNRRGKARLQLIVSARTVGSDGFAAETALPNQVVNVVVLTNYNRLSKRVGAWALAAFIGGMIARFGQGSVDTILTLWRGFE